MKKFALSLYVNYPFFSGLFNFLYKKLVTMKRYRNLVNSSVAKELIEFEYKKYSELKNLQNIKLKKLLHHCYNNVPYYKKIFQENNITIIDIDKDPEGALDKVPKLTKQKLNENWELLQASNICVKSTSLITTGGSTGTPQKFLFTSSELLVRDAHWWRWEKIAGVDRISGSDRLLYIGMDKRFLDNPNLPGFKASDDIYIVNPLGMSSERLNKIYEDIMKFDPTYIRGYASASYLFATYFKGLEIKFTLKSILTSSDQLHTYMKEVIEKTFDCKVTDFYGQNEDVATAIQCSFGNYHINMENNLVETDEDGNIYATHLEHYYMPLLNYQVNDIGVLNKSFSCECGRSTDVFTNIIGRVDDYLIDSNGNTYSAGALNQPMKSDVGSIKEIQYIQTDYKNLIVNFVKGPEFTDRSLDELACNICKYTNSSFKIEFFECENSIPRLSNGKFRLIVREF